MHGTKSENSNAFEAMSFDELLSLREQLDAFIGDRLGAEERELESRLARIKRLKQSPSISSEEVIGRAVLAIHEDVWHTVLVD